MVMLWFTSLSVPSYHFPNPKSTFFSNNKALLRHPYCNTIFSLPVSGISGNQNLTISSFLVPSTGAYPERKESLKFPPTLLQLAAASAVLFLGFGVRSCLASSTRFPAVISANSQTVQDQRIQDNHDPGKYEKVENKEDRELEEAFEKWKSKTFSLTVPLRIVALRGSVPPSWIKDFMKSQGRRLALRSELRGSLNDIFSDLSMSLSKDSVGPKSSMAADVITVGDSWLNFAIKKAIIEPIQGVEDQDWFKNLSERWKVYLRRNSNGELDSKGKIWAAPYRWGSIVIAYKKSQFKKRKLAPIEDWSDLWRPELAGRISMIDCPREVVGAVLKYMGASYNTQNIESQVGGGRDAVEQNLALLGKQVRLFDSMHYLKAFAVGDVWVAVGWSSDVLPAAKRMSNVTVVVPKSGTSLWVDLWAIPAASSFKTEDRIGGRIRGPSPLIHQWMDFCLQTARALPFKQEIIPGASPFDLENPPPFKVSVIKGKPKLDTNLLAGTPPPEILAKCEFLEPLSDVALSDYKRLMDNMQKPGHGFIHGVQHSVLSLVESFLSKLRAKVT